MTTELQSNVQLKKRKEVPFPRVKIINFTREISLSFKAGETDPKTLSAKQGANYFKLSPGRYNRVRNKNKKTQWNR